MSGKRRGRPRIKPIEKGSEDDKKHIKKLEENRKLKSYVRNEPLISKTNELLKMLGVNEKYDGSVYLAKQKMKVALFEFIMDNMKKKDF